MYDTDSPTYERSPPPPYFSKLGSISRSEGLLNSSSQCCSLQCLFLLSDFCRSNNICPVLIYHSVPSELVKSEQLSVDINQSQLHDDILDTMMHKYVEL